MVIGAIEFDILLGDVHTLKEKRSVVRPIVAEIRRRFEVSAAEVGEQDVYRRAVVGAAVVASDSRHVVKVLDEIERHVASRPEIELLSAHRTLHRSSDE